MRLIYPQNSTPIYFSTVKRFKPLCMSCKLTGHPVPYVTDHPNG
uniref:Uncharacterized protein n=1 Tax=Anguilla anguilla TaxID=7936 RepID=A0A0E9QZY1_ANGAN